MADLPEPPELDFTFDTAGARAAGFTDADIAATIAPQAGFDLEGARKAGFTDSQIVDWLAPERSPEPPAPAEKARFWHDIERGLQETRSQMQTLGATVAGRRLQEIEEAKAKADRGEFLAPLERAMVAQYDEAKANAERQLAETTEGAVGYRQKAAELPISPEYKAFKEAAGKGAMEALTAFWKAPGEVLTSLLAEQSVASLPPVAGAVVGGPVGGAIVAGGQGYIQGYAAKVTDLLAKRGIDVNDPRAIREALSDPDISREIRSEAAVSAIPQGAAGAASMLVAGRALAPSSLATRPVAQQAVNIPSQAVAQGAIEAAGEAGSQAIIGEPIEGGQVVAAGIGGAAQGPIDVAALAVHRGGARALGRTPEEVARPILEAGTVDDAIATARAVVDQSEVDARIAEARELGAPEDVRELEAVGLFGRLQEGRVEQDQTGNWFYTGPRGEMPIREWDGAGRDDTISSETAQVQRDVYGRMGFDVVYFEDSPNAPFDGAFDPARSNTIFLSNNPQRNAALVGAHEVTHALDGVTLPDGTRLGDLYLEQVEQGLTERGWQHARDTFGENAPKRELFPEGAEGDAAHEAAVKRFLIAEMGADIGGEAPKFATFTKRVVDEVQQRYGVDVARDVLRSFLDQVRQSIQRMREFFFSSREAAEYTAGDTASQNWVTNLEDLHGTLAKMWAERFGTQAEKENARFQGMRDRGQREQVIRQGFAAMEGVAARTQEGRAAESPPRAEPTSPNAEAAPPETVPSEPRITPPAQRARVDEIAGRLATMRRWLAELDQERRQAAPTSLAARELQARINTILGKVRGREERLTRVAKDRLEAARTALDVLLNPAEDTPDMVRVRQAIQAEQAQLAQAAGVGTPSRGMERALEAPQEPRAAPPEAVPARGQAVMAQPAEQSVVAPEPVQAQPVAQEARPQPEARQETVPEPAPPVAEMPAAPPSFEQRLREGKETVWADRSVMGRVQRGLPRNERFATDVARERIMREDAAPLIRRAIEEDGIPEDAIPEIARLYRQEEGESVEMAFDRAVDRWVTKREAEAARAYSDEDVATYDFLKAEADRGDPVLAEAFGRLEEMYTGRERGSVDEDIPFGDNEASRATARQGETPAPTPVRPEGAEDGGRSGSRGPLAGEADAELGPKFSPRVKVDPEALAPKGRSFEGLRLLARAAYDKLVRDRIEVVNEATGRAIKFDSRGRRKTLAAGEDLLRLIPALPDLLRAAEPMGPPRPDRAGRSEIIAWHALRAIAEIEGRPFAVVMTVRELRDGSYHYDLGGGPEGETAGGRSLPAPEDHGDAVGSSARNRPSDGDLNIVPVDLPRKPPVFSPRAEARNIEAGTEAGDVDALRTRRANAESERIRRLREKGLLPSEAQEGGVKPEDEPKFSPRARDIQTGPDGRSQLFDDDVRRWRNNHQNFLAPGKTADATVLRQNFVLQAVSGRRGAVTISPKVAQAVAAKHWDIPAGVWRDLPELLVDPKFVYPHRDGGLNVVIDRTTARGEPIIVGIRDGAIHTITPIHDTPDATGNNRLAGYVGSNLDQGRRVYAETAAFLSQLSALRSGAMEIPKRRGSVAQTPDRQSGGRPPQNVLTRDEVIKTQQKIYYSPRRYTPEQQRAIDNAFAKPTTTRENIATAREDAGRKFVRTMLDPYIGLKRDDPEAYMAARLANSSAGAFHYFLEQGPLKFTHNALDADAAAQNGGVNALRRDLGNEAGDFMKWVVGNRAERLKAEDRENLLKDTDIAALKSMNKGKLGEDYVLSNGNATRSREAAYLDALKRLDALNRNVMDLAVQSGLVKRETADALIANPFYVPFYRAAEESGSRSFAGAQLSNGLVKQYAFKKLKGGQEKLRDPWDNAVGNWEHMIDAAMRNRTSVRILDAASVRGLDAVEKVKPQDYHNMTKAEKAKTVWVMEEGEKVYYRVDDPMVLTAVSALETASSNGIFMRVGRGFAKLLRYGVTMNPLFAVRTAIRDTQNAIAVSEVSANPFKNIADGFEKKDIANRLGNVARAVTAQEKLWRPLEQEEASALAGGALMRLGAWNEGGVDSKSVTSAGKFWRYITNSMDAWKDVVGTAEDINRMAIYRQLRAKGLPHDYASFQGRDLQDFTLKGAASWVRTITELTPFLNARMQGLYKIGRAAADSDQSVGLAVGKRVATSLAVRAATVLGAMTVAGLALDAIYHDDEDYKKRTEFDRQTYYWFKIGNAQFRIPKGFELAALSSLAVDGIEVFFDPKMTGQRVVDNFWSSLGSNLQVQAPAFAQPVLDIALNTRGTGGSIEPMGSERLQAEQRYTINNTMFSRGVSAAMNKGLRAVSSGGEGLSPVQIDYLVSAYTGWLGTNVLGMADMAVRSLASEPERPAKDFLATLTQGLVRTDPAPQSRFVDMLYKQSGAIERAYNTYRELIRRERPEEAQRHLEANKELIAKYPTFEAVKRLEGDLNAQIRQTTNSPGMSAEQKRIRIMHLNALKSRAAEGLFSAGERP